MLRAKQRDVLSVLCIVLACMGEKTAGDEMTLAAAATAADTGMVSSTPVHTSTTPASTTTLASSTPEPLVCNYTAGREAPVDGICHTTSERQVCRNTLPDEQEQNQKFVDQCGWDTGCGKEHALTYGPHSALDIILIRKILCI